MKRRPVAIFTLASVLGCMWVAAGDPGVSQRMAFLFHELDRGQVVPPMWAGIFDDPHPLPRALAVEVLGSAANPDCLPRLQRFAADHHPWVRRQVMIAAGRIGPPAGGLAKAGLRAPEVLVREAAAWAMCHCGGVTEAELGQLLLKERDPDVLRTLLANAWRLDGVEWHPQIGRFLHHANATLRRAAATSLARDPGAASRPGLAILAKDPDPVVRALAVSGFRHGELAAADLERLAAALEDPDWRVQIAACQALSAPRTELALGEPLKATVAARWSSSHAHLAIAALEVAASVPFGRGKDLEKLASDDSRPWAAATALRAMARNADGSAAKLVATWIGAEELWKRRAAAQAVWLLGDTTQRKKIDEEALADRSPAVRLAWLGGMPEAEVPTRSADIRALIDSDADPAVRAQCVQMLADAKLLPPTEDLLALVARWKADTMGDGRAAALIAALDKAAGDADRQRVLMAGLTDPDPACAAQVIAHAHSKGISVRTPQRDPRHGMRWYEDLVEWLEEDHWLDVVTSRGTFRLRLDAANAPFTAREFSELATSGFYDGLTFHRVVPNFVVQGGDPRGDGWGGPGFVLPDEPSLVPFEAWRVGIATSGPNTGGCQLFITLLPAYRLDGHYTNFAEVVSGHEVVEALEVGDRIVTIRKSSGTPAEPTRPAEPQ